MGIFSRIGEIVNANINSMLDKAEDPAKMVKLMIHEMEDTLMEIKSSAAEVIADQKRLQRKIRHEVERRDDWADKAELALSKEREDLARQALEQKLLSVERLEAMRLRIKEIEGVADQYREDIGRLEEKLQNAKARQRALMAAQKKAETRKKVEEKIYQANSQGAFHRFEDYESRLARMEADAEILGHSNDTLEKKFRDLEHEQAVEKELEALKKQKGE